MTDELNLLNSYDTWHGEYAFTCMYKFLLILGTKNAAKQLKKITEGANKWEGVNWWRELADKRRCKFVDVYTFLAFRITYNIGKSTKVHLYWSMKNCNGSPGDLRCKIMNTSKHYQVIVST